MQFGKLPSARADVRAFEEGQRGICGSSAHLTALASRADCPALDDLHSHPYQVPG